jgi:hypothetical protein
MSPLLCVSACKKLEVCALGTALRDLLIYISSESEVAAHGLIRSDVIVAPSSGAGV